MRIVLVATMVLAVAASALAQENEPLPKDTSNPKQAFYMSAADLAATAAKLPARPSANTTILERYAAVLREYFARGRSVRRTRRSRWPTRSTRRSPRGRG